MFFWGPIFGPGVIKKKGWLLRNHRFNIFFHWPWTWWVPGSRSIKDPHLKLLKSRAQAKKRGWSRFWMMSLQKKCIFLRWWSVFSWQGPFNGCLSRIRSTKWFYCIFVELIFTVKVLSDRFAFDWYPNFLPLWPALFEFQPKLQVFWLLSDQCK